MQYCMLLWRKPSNDMDSLITDAYQTFSVFVQLGGEFAPRYLTGSKKTCTPEFSWSKKNFKKQLLDCPVNRGNEALGNLGYSVSFFSSHNEKGSLSFRATLGNQRLGAFDVIVVNFPSTLTEDHFFKEQLADIFKKCVVLFNPYWGCVTEAMATGKFSPLVVNGIPSAIHRMNFWSQELINLMGDVITKQIFKSYNFSPNNGFFQINEAPVELRLNGSPNVFHR